MSFFKKIFNNKNNDKNKSSVVTKKEFKQEVVKTDNVSTVLSNISKKYNLPISRLDFDILNIETYIKMNKETDFALMDINDEIENMIIEKELLLKDDFEIKQSYEIRIRRFKPQKDFELLGSLKSNKSLTIAKFIVSPASKLIYSEKLKDNILNELYKKKLRLGMIIKFKVLEKHLLNKVEELIKIIKVMQKLDKEFSIPLCEGIKPFKPVKMEVIEHYKNLNNKKDNKKELIFPIKKGQIVIEVIKPKDSKNGRNCRGKFIEVPDIKRDNVKVFKIKEDEIKIEEDDNSVKYIANKDGYVYVDDSSISIKKDLEVQTISLKTGNVSGAKDSNVKLEVNESDVMKEAIADGMKVETTELVVKGNIGNKVEIKAKKLVIEGQTHGNSKIVADEAEINVHRGSLIGKKINVTRLEGGKIKADKVFVKQAISGQIIAKQIEVDILGSHLTLIASEFIEITTLKGSENKLIIDESKVENRDEKIEKQEKMIKDLKIKFKKMKEKYANNKKIIARNQSSVNELQKKIIQYKKSKMPIKPIWLEKLRKFYDFVKETKKIEESLKEVLEDIEILKEQIDSFQNNVYLAKIISHSGFTEFNRIEFDLINPDKTITYDTKVSDENTKIFRLKDFGENDYKIVGSSNDSWA